MSDGSLFVLEEQDCQNFLLSEVFGENMSNEELIATKLKLEIEDMSNQTASELNDGTELVEVKFYKQYGKLNIEALIWKKEGITLEDCEAFHNLLSAKLDSIEDEFADDYVLNVSSQGLDRKIVTDDDFRRALDCEIECVDDKKKKHHGYLISYDDTTVCIKPDGNQREIKLQRKLLTKVQPYIRF